MSYMRIKEFPIRQMICYFADFVIYNRGKYNVEDAKDIITNIFRNMQFTDLHTMGTEKETIENLLNKVFEELEQEINKRRL